MKQSDNKPHTLKAKIMIERLMCNIADETVTCRRYHRFFRRGLPPRLFYITKEWMNS